MRQIKFRGKDINTKEWVYGSLCKVFDQCKIAMISTFETECSGYITEVDCESVGQFTGLLDKNGKEIYEGDIVKYYDDIVDEFLSAEVIYHQDSCSFCCAPLHGDMFGLGAHWQFEVIGNIYDNSELLNEK